MNAHYLHGGARWGLLPALSAAGGALAFLIGEGPGFWTWRMGLAAGLAVGLAVAVTPKFSLAPLVAVVAGALAALVVGMGSSSRTASEVLQGLVKPEPLNLILPAVTALPAFLNAFRLSEGLKWAWVNILLQGAVGFLVPAALWWFNEPVEMDTFVPFLLLAAAHVVAVEIPAYLCPSRD
jgi:hypothetical protein